VGLCALVAALDYKPKHLFAIDAVPSRLELARSLGAEPLNFKEDYEGTKKRIMEVTQGRGADVVMEVVGLAPALRTAYELVRPFGFISSVGVHNAEARSFPYLTFDRRGGLLMENVGVDPYQWERSVCEEY
jgi:threonine dehydrogenase-like Zn-dependent dehydrogenase